MTGIRRYQISFAVALPPVVRQLILVTVLAYVFQAVTGHRWDRIFGLVPSMVMSGGAVWQLVTYALQHASPFHLAWNMLVLWMFGTEIEISWGARRFIIYYLTCTMGAAVATVAVGPGSQTVTIGASGAIFGILAAFAALFPDRQVAFMLLFPMRAKYFVMILAGLQFLLFAEGGGGIAYAAHLGGLLTGIAFLAVSARRVFRPALPKSRRPSRRPKLAVVLPPRDGEPTEDKPVESAEIDRILDRISSVGIGGLTDRERAVLERASKVLERREDGDA